MTAANRSPPRDVQAPLAFPHAPNFDRAAFVLSPSNREAAQAVDAWPAWRGGVLALHGPAGAGKTHLGRAWARSSGAHVVAAGENIAAIPAGPVLFEDADAAAADVLIFHLINRAETGGGLLLTARSPPRTWRADLPDLRSRLNVLRHVALGAPDDALLEAVLVKLFRERAVRPAPELLAYLVQRMERSVTAAQDLVLRLDQRALASGRGVTRAVARELFEIGDNSGPAAG